nr:MAG: reverse transcriptase [Marsupenaeus japonicus endogenous nimavirus]
MYRTRGKKCLEQQCEMIKDDNDSILINLDRVQKRWAEYITSLYSEVNTNKRSIWNRKMIAGPITSKEIKHAIKILQMENEIEYNNIPFEFKTLPDCELVEIVNHVYDSKITFEKLLESIFMVLPKRSETVYEKVIILMIYVSKIVLKVMLIRNRTTIRKRKTVEQFGYRFEKETTNAIFCMRMLMEKCIEKQKDMYICCINYVKPFTCVKYDKLRELQEKLKIDRNDLRLINNLYDDEKKAINFHRKINDWIDMKKECVLSPDLFNLYSEEALGKIKACEGVDLEGTNYNNFRYADNIVLIADSEEKLQSILDIITRESERVGSEIKSQKSCVMVTSKKALIPECCVMVNGIQIEQVNSFKYLGSWITSDGRSDTDIKYRIDLAKKAFMDMKNILCAHNIKIENRKYLFNYYIRPILLYGCESWTITKNMEKRLEAVEVWFWRNMINITRISDEYTLDSTEIKKELLHTIKLRQLNFIGRELRKEGGIEKNIMKAEMAGKRARGRQRSKMLDWMTKEFNIKDGEQLGVIIENWK